MAKKTMPSHAAAKKAASSKKPAPAVKSKPVTAKPAVKAVAKPVTKTAAKPAPARPAPTKSAAKAAASAVAKSPPKTLPVPVKKAVEPQKSVPVPVPEVLPEPVTAAAGSPPPLSTLPKTVPLTVTVQTSQGLAANGNTQPANLLVIVTSAGWPVTELDKNHFTLMQHFEVPGQTAPFSNSITTYRNAGSGAYLLQTKPINGAPWRSGHHLGQLLVSNSEDQQGQAAFKIIIR